MDVFFTHRHPPDLDTFLITHQIMMISAVCPNGCPIVSNSLLCPIYIWHNCPSLSVRTAIIAHATPSILAALRVLADFPAFWKALAFAMLTGHAPHSVTALWDLPELQIALEDALHYVAAVDPVVARRLLAILPGSYMSIRGILEFELRCPVVRLDEKWRV